MVLVDYEEFNSDLALLVILVLYFNDFVDCFAFYSSSYYYYKCVDKPSVQFSTYQFLSRLTLCGAALSFQLR